MNDQLAETAPATLHNRIPAVMAHTSRYAFKGRSRLAKDAGVSRSTITRLIEHHSVPSFRLVSAVTQALEKQIGRSLDPREIFSYDGTYPTPSACALCGCPGCMPECAYDEEGCLKTEYRDMRPGDWSFSQSLGSPEEVL